MAQAATSMTPEQVKKIKANCEDIVKRVQADDIMDYFVDEDYFSIEDVAENIMSGKTPQHQTERLVMLLQQKRSKAGIFDFFLNQLARHGNKDLAKKIRETEEALRKEKKDKALNAKRFRFITEEEAGAEVTQDEVRNATAGLQKPSPHRLENLKSLKHAFSQGIVYIDAFFSIDNSLN
ncbi:uncharacterized protein LOC110463079 [Mizuhopecten yessoensis]|uniref:uncharacterized protein LOC110463079 n=1 Tax=Mizuhopecten yessoensis TaxID=6573 RepID=UPI000B457CD2|nr:uncharacterized protein LOC110463079 [Mizuhopecten yessoensis]